MPGFHILVKGKVQGVFYRASARDKAGELGITGWVKNTREGDVEIFASGKEDPLDRFLTWCKQGPPGAIVTSVTVLRQISSEESTMGKFEIRRDP